MRILRNAEGISQIGGLVGSIGRPLKDPANTLRHPGFRPRIERQSDTPCRGNCLLQLFRRNIDGPEKRTVRSVLTVIRLACRLIQISRDEIAVHGMENRAVKEQGVPFAPLGVSGNFHPIDRQITDAPKRGGRLPSMERAGDSFKNKPIRALDIRQIYMPCQRQHECIRETARSLQDGSAAAGAPKHRYSILSAGSSTDIVE